MAKIIAIITSPEEAKFAKIILKSYVQYDIAASIKEALHEYAKMFYVRKNSASTYLDFMSRNVCTFDKVHPQSTNYQDYFSMFSVVSQRIYGDCIEECLDKAIDYENGKPRPIYWTFHPNGSMDVTYKIHHKNG